VLDDAAAAEPLDRELEVLVDGQPGRLRHAQAIEELLLDLAILDRAQHRRARAHRHDLLDRVEDLGRDVLGVERDHVDLLREVDRRLEIVECTDHHTVGDLGGGTARVRIEHHDANSPCGAPRAAIMRPS